MSAMLQKRLLRYWVEGASVAVTFVAFFAKQTVPFNNYLGAVEMEKRSLTPEGEIER